MRPDLDYSEPKNLYNEACGVSKGFSMEVMKSLAESQHFNSLNDVGNSALIDQKLQTREQRRMSRQVKLSPIMWRLILTIGDGVLLLALFALVLLLAPQLNLIAGSARDDLGNWNSRAIWGLLALASWGIAVSMTQAQVLINASNRFKSPLHVLFALMLMLVFWLVPTYLFITTDVAYAKTLLFFLILAAPAFSIWRLIFAEIISLPRFHHQVVIVGANAAGEIIAKELRSVKRANVKVLGYISEGTHESPERNGLPILGNRSTLYRLAQSGVIDMIIIAIDHKDNPELFQVAIETAQPGISVIPMTMAYERLSGMVPVEYIGDQWSVALPLEPSISSLYLLWHKVMDLTFGLCGLILLLLVLPVLGPLIHLDSPGPIFYSQERVGYLGKKFYIRKFRTMHTDAEHPGQAVWAAVHDTRVTRIGRFLRATHIDELPQVLNILLGEMSLIGPRPERQAFITALEKTIPFYRYRLNVKPGLTGWAQVKYPYTNTSHGTLIKLQRDLYYIKHRSFMLDIVIILKTVVEVFLHRGT